MSAFNNTSKNDIRLDITRRVIKLTSALLITLTLLVGSTKFVPANAVGVKVNAFGGVQKQVLDTGLHFKLPFVDKVYTISTMVQSKSMESITTQTKDGQWLNTYIDVKYRVKKSEAMTIFSNYRTLENVDEKLIQPSVQRAIEKVTGEYDIFEILGSKRTEVYDKIDESIKAIFEENNLEFAGFTITDQDAGDEIEQAIKDESVRQKQVDTARQDQEKAKIEAETAKVKAQGEADAKVIAAEGEAKANRELSGSITDELIKMKEAEARLKHGWVEVQTGGDVITNTGN